MHEEALRQQSLLAAIQASTADQAHCARVAADLGLGGPSTTISLARGLQAYRANAVALAERALATAYPRLHAELGQAQFKALAWQLWRESPPLRGDVARWGADLPTFLASRADPVLGELAALEWQAHLSEAAADATLEAASLALLGEHEAALLGLRMRPGLALLRLSPQACQLAGLAASTEADGDQAVLVWRQQWRAREALLDEAGAALIDAVLAGRSLEQALDTALSLDPAHDFGVFLRRAINDEWLQAVCLLA